MRATIGILTAALLMLAGAAGAAAQPAAGAGPTDAQVKARVDALLAQDDARGEGRPARADRGRVLHAGSEAARAGDPAGGAGSVLWLNDTKRFNELQKVAVEESRLKIPAPLRPRRDPRLPHDLPGAARDGRLLGPFRPRARRGRRGEGGTRRRDPLDVRADARHRARRALGPHRRGRGRGPVPRSGDGRGTGARLPGPAARHARPPARLRQALRRLRRGRRWPRLRPLVPPGRAAPQRLLPAVQGRGRRRRRQLHERVHGPQQRAGRRQQVAAHRRSARGVGLPGLRGERRDGRRQPRDPALRPRPQGRRLPRAHRRQRHGDGERRLPRAPRRAREGRQGHHGPARHCRPPRARGQGAHGPLREPVHRRGAGGPGARRPRAPPGGADSRRSARWCCCATKERRCRSRPRSRAWR